LEQWICPGTNALCDCSTGLASLDGGTHIEGRRADFVVRAKFDHLDKIFKPLVEKLSAIPGVLTKHCYVSVVYKNVRIFTAGVLTMLGWGVYKPDH
jgi:hypothetical protein